MASVAGETETQSKEAGDLYELAIVLRQKLHETLNTPATSHALATAFFNAGAFYKDTQRMRKAYEIWQELSQTHPEYGKFRDRAAKYCR